MGLVCECVEAARVKGSFAPCIHVGRTGGVRAGDGHGVKPTNRKDSEVLESNCSQAVLSPSLCLWEKGDKCLQEPG